MKIVYNGFEIDVDEYQFVLYQKSKGKKGQPIMALVGYYSKLKTAIRRIAHLELAKKRSIVSLKEFIEKYEALVEKLTEHIKV